MVRTLRKACAFATVVLSILTLTQLSAQDLMATQRIFGAEGIDMIESVHHIGNDELVMVARTADNSSSNSSISIVRTTVQLESFSSVRVHDGNRLIPYASAIDDDGSVVVVGVSNAATTSSGTFNQTFTRVGVEGNLLSHRNWGLDNRNDQLYGCVRDASGDFVSCGFRSSETTIDSRRPLLRKTNAQGFVIWSKVFSQTARSEFRNVAEVSDGYVFSGYTNQTGEHNTLLVKTDFDGNLIWSRIIDINNVTTNSQTGNNNRRDLFVTNDGSILIRVRYRENVTNARRHTAVVKVDPTGSVLWSKRIDFGQRDLELNSIIEGHDNGEYIIVGHSNALSEDNIDGVVLSFTDGEAGPEPNWLNLFVGPGRDEIRSGVKFQTGPTKGYILIGDTDSYTSSTDRDAWIIRTNAQGGNWSNANMDCWADNLPFAFSNLPMTVSSAGGTVTDWHFVVIHEALAESQPLVPINNDNLCGNGVIGGYVVNIAENSHKSALNLYPNPTYGAVNLSLEGTIASSSQVVKVFNLMGQVAHTQELNGMTNVVLDLSHLERAIYLVVVEDDSRVVLNERLIIH